MKMTMFAALALVSFGAHGSNGFGSESQGFAWSFEKDGEHVFDAPYDGMHVGCAKFSPQKVDFRVELVNEPSPGLLPVYIKQTGGVYLGGGKYHEVRGADGLEFVFYPGNRYRVKNMTGEAVRGYECDAGTAPGAPSMPGKSRSSNSRS